MTQSTDPQSAGLGPEDRKIVTLARSARARNGVPEGAAVRDETGRTYVAGTVDLSSLKLSALQTAVAMAVASGAKSLEAAAVVTEAEAVPEADRAAVRDLGGPDTPVVLAGPDGTVRLSVQAG
ncbi:cytidine deaminase [Streptomyces sp. NPDC091376]|uniref:cytidine deaminase n=1 Tax=Streptomyces sp. NPDC091376 TaxID=3365994 RepID=UPI00381C9A4F